MSQLNRTSHRIQKNGKPTYFHNMPDIYDISEAPEIRPGRSGPGDIEARLASAKANLFVNGFRSLLDAALHEAVHAMDESEFRQFSDAGCLTKLVETFRDAGLLSMKVRREICEVLGTHNVPDASVYHAEFEAIRKSPVLNRSLAQQPWSPSNLETFNFGNIYSQLQQKSPNLLQLLQSFVSPVDAAESDAANGKRRVVMALSSMAHCRSKKTNFVPAMFSLYQYASGVPERPMLCMNHLGFGVSRRTLGRVLEQMAKYARGRLRGLGPSKHPVIFVFDNLTVPATVRYARLHNNSELLSYTAGYALLPPPSHQPMRFLQRSDLRIHRANAICIDDFIPTTLDLNNIHLCLQALVLQATRTCARYLEIKVPNVNDKMPSLEPIDVKEAPRVHPLPTYDYNEAIVDEVIEILNSIKEDVGMTPCQAEEELFLFFGDLLTVQNIRYLLLDCINLY